MVEIKKVNWGVANVIDGNIYVNKRLCDDSDLFLKVMEHEMKHIRDPKNLDVDLNEKSTKGLSEWILKNPSSWVQFSPILFFEGKVLYCKLMMYFWILIFTLIGGGVLLIWMLL